MNKLKILPPKECAANAEKTVNAWKREQERAALKAKRNPPAVKALEKKAVVEEPKVKLSKEKREGLNRKLQVAVRDGKKDEVKRLLKAGADVNAKDNSGGSVLLYAVYEGHKDVVELLIGEGANVNAKYDNEWSVLDLAMTNGKTEVAELLKKHGAKPGSELP